VNPSLAPEVRVLIGDDGYPAAATAMVVAPLPPSALWPFIADLPAWGGRVPMIHRVRQRGAEVEVQLRFRVTLFSTSFAFVAERVIEPERRMTLAWRAGEPRDLRLDVQLEPRGEGTELRATIGFDLLSLGWVVSLFLRHHPEIRCGVLPGCALALIDALLRQAAPSGP
jgi:hypothetical protein